MICTGVSGSGVRTGTDLIPAGAPSIRRDLQRARTACSAAAVGAAWGENAGRRVATSTRRARPAMSVSGWCWSQVRRELRRSVGASNTTMPLVDSLSPRQRSGERVRERGFQLAAPIRWKVPLSPALSPLVPRREREREASTMVVLSRWPGTNRELNFEMSCLRLAPMARKASSSQVHARGFGDIIGIALIAGSVLTLVALLSYDPRDISVNSTETNLTPPNWIRQVGAPIGLRP